MPQELLRKAPGRVNLIGEHTDYNDGFVMPAAIGYYTFASATRREDRAVIVGSELSREPAVFDLDALWLQRRGDWSDYARGILIELERAHVELRGANLAVHGTIPFGAGLSSSASFEVGFALALLGIAEATFDNVELAWLCQRAEIEHVGTQCGIMDQYAALFGQAGCVLLLDTRSLASAALPLPESARIVICNTMTRRELASSEFNHRRAQCESVVERFHRWQPSVTALRDLTLEDLATHRSELPPELYQRARHVLSENARVLEAAEALQRGDLRKLGSLMNASHASLRTDYAVSSPELDLMVAIAQSDDAVYGARMTGGGFGGCTVNLVDAGAERAFRDRIVSEYWNATGVSAELYDGTPVAGAAMW
ncbi:MAG: galactokinase [Candidatus Eremiobacteraeota bacterium]|nr:galactokinase [Candidatus Eremiobacteraeota bacterium]